MPYRPALPVGLGRWLLSHRVFTLFAIAVLTAIAGYALTRVPLRVSILRGLMADETQYQEYRKRAESFGGGTDDLIYVATDEGDELFEPETLDALRRAARDIQKLPEIKRVIPFVDVPRLDSERFSSGMGRITQFAMRKELSQGKIPRFFKGNKKLPMLWPEKTSDEDDDEFFRPSPAEVRRLVDGNFIANRLVSESRTAHIMLVWLDRSSDVDSRAQSGIRPKIEAILKQHDLAKNELHFVGTQIIQDWMFDEVIRALQGILPITALVVCVLVYITFHRLSYVFLTLIIAAIAIVWSIGLSAALFGQITLLVVAVPALILVISTADTIHLISAYVAELRAGMPREQAIEKMFQDVGGACVLTSITTFIGFLSLLVVPATTLRHMAVAAAVGVASALFLALVFVPMALSILKEPSTDSQGRWSINGLFDRGLGICARISLSVPKSVIVVHLIVICVCVYFASLLTIDSDLPRRFPGEHSISKAVRYFEKESFGTGVVELYFQTNDDDFLSPEFFSALAQFETKLLNHDEVFEVASITRVLRSVNRFIGWESDDGMPNSTEMALATIDLLSMMDSNAVDGLISKKDRTIRVTVRVNSTRVVHVYKLSEEFRELAIRSMPAFVTVDTSGYYPIVGLAVQELIKNQIDGFLLCFICVMAVVAFGTRSIKLSVLAVIPNLLPLVLLGGTLGAFFDVVDSDVLGIAIVSFGLAVDDTIHFLHRFEIESAETGNVREALEKTFSYTGSAILKTTIILGMGLAPFSLSGYFSIWLLGTYLVFVLACAVFADLLLLPALILTFVKTPSKNEAEQPVV
jgi:predicted RND superfamily exporter protein